MTDDASLLFLRMLSRGAIDLEGVLGEYLQMTPQERRDGIFDARAMLEFLSGEFRTRGLIEKEERIAAYYIEWLCIAEAPDEISDERIAAARKELFDRYFGGVAPGA